MPTPMKKRFEFRREPQPGAAWLSRFQAGRAEAEAWYRGTGREEPASASACAEALRTHMPELVPDYERACALVGDDPLAHCVLSHYRPAPLRSGCTQAVWRGRDGPALVRNYDFSLDVVSDGFESTAWHGREVIAKVQRPWGGCLDGMNADGLVASMTFGGDPAQGRGFAVILVVRYVLETCSRVGDGVAALCRIPLAQAHNVTLLDASGDHATVFLRPGSAPEIGRQVACANHQPAASRAAPPARLRDSVARQRAAERALDAPGATLASVVAAFLAPPIHVRRASSPTVYTAVYRPAEKRVEYVWPGHTVPQAIGSFRPTTYGHDDGDLAA